MAFGAEIAKEFHVAAEISDDRVVHRGGENKFLVIAAVVLIAKESSSRFGAEFEIPGQFYREWEMTPPSTASLPR